MIGDPTNRRLLIGRSLMAFAVGVAQLFRTLPEQVVAVVFIVGAVLLALATVLVRRELAAIGMGILAVAFAARALSVVALVGTQWHGKLIVLATWGWLSFTAANRCRRIAGGW